MKLTRSRGVAVMVLVTLLWSTAGVVTRQLESARSFEVTFWRSFFTALSLLVILPLWRGRTAFSGLVSASPTLWLSGVCWAVMFTAFMVALTLTSVANVLVTMAISPLLTALLARVFIGYRIALRTWLATAAAGIGIGWMYSGQISLSNQWAGTLVALLVPLAGASNWTLVQYSGQRGSNIDLVPAVLAGAVLSCVATLPLSLPFSATVYDLSLLATLGLFQLAIPCILSVLCASVLKAPEISLLGLLEVIFGILLVWLGAGEAPGMHVLTGGGLVIAALSFNELISWRQTK